MKNRMMLALLALGFLASSVPALRSAEKDAESMISHAESVLMAQDRSRDAILDALAEVLDATLLILRKTEYEAEFRSRVEFAKKTFEDRILFSAKARQYLGLAYMLVTGGKSWQVPDELSPEHREKDFMAQAKRVCQSLIDSAQAELKAGRNESAVRFLLEFVLMVITPVQA